MPDPPTDAMSAAPPEPGRDDGIPPGRLEDGGNVVDARVVLLTNFIPPYRLRLFEALSDRVSSLAVLVSTPVEGNRPWLPDSGRLEVHVQRSVTFRRPWKHPAGFADSAYVHFPWDTLVQLRRFSPDVVVSGELGFRSLLSALYCRRSSHARLVIWATLSERTEQGRGPLRRTLRGWLLRQADHVIVNGASGERYVRRFGVPLERIQRIPYSALPDFAAAGAVPRPSREKIRHLVFVGQLTERKGLMPFVRALDEWAQANPDRELTLTVAGSGPLLPALEGFRPGGSLSLQILGEVDRLELPHLLARADALVFPTLADEWGLVVNEALATGLPVIGSVHSQAVEELCDDGVTGWVFDPEDSSSTRNAIERAFATSGDRISAMRERARERVLPLTPEWTAERLVDSIRMVRRAPSRHRREVGSLRDSPSEWRAEGSTPLMLKSILARTSPRIRGRIYASGRLHKAASAAASLIWRDDGWQWCRISGGAANGLWIQAQPRSQKFQLSGTYEPAVHRLLAQNLSRGVLWDVGAHVGYFTLVALSLGYEVLAIEPNPQSAERIRAALTRNGLHAAVIEVAVGAHQGRAELEVRAESSMTRVAGRDGSVAMTTLDALYERNTDAAPTVVKIDVEGLEMAVLEGAERLLSEAGPTLVVEIHDQANSSQLMNRLPGYEGERLDNDHFVARPRRRE